MIDHQPALTNESIRAVEEIVMCDRQISARSIANELGISKTSLYKIMNDYLGMKKFCTRWASKLLTSLQRINRADFCEELLENCNQDATRFVSSIVTDDETWVHHYDPLSQQEAKTWKKPSEKTPTRPRVTRSAGEIIKKPSSGIVKVFFSSIFYYVVLQSMVRITHQFFTG